MRRRWTVLWGFPVFTTRLSTPSSSPRSFTRGIENDPAPWEAGSPYTYLEDNPEVSVLLLHGEEDQLVPVSSSELFADALTASGHDVSLELLAGGDHQSTRQPDPAGPLILDFLSS